MTDLLTLLSRHATAARELAETEAAIRIAERQYWTEHGFSVLPRRKRLLSALREDGARPTPLEAYIERIGK